MIKIMSIAGARPNFMKLASIVRAIESHNQRLNEKAPGKDETSAGSRRTINHIIVHTGQHYDAKMSHSFFEDLGIPKPDINLEVGSGSHAEQTAEIMKRFEPVLLQEQPDVLLVVGDVNSTIACTLVASKVQYTESNTNRSKRTRPLIVHVEAGLRSFDRDMPEEINRILTDAISDLLFVTEESGKTNLLQEGVPRDKIHFVGNVMIDTLKQHLERADSSDIRKRLDLPLPYVLVTLHRPSNVDRRETLEPLIGCLERIAEQKHIVFPVHPRTRNSLESFGLYQNLEKNKNITLAEPLGYLDFLNLIKNASAVVTDSGGIQEETTVLQVPCVTLRENTERPVTVAVGTNYLIGTKPTRIMETVNEILSGQGKQGEIPPLWDGQAGDRIVGIISKSVEQ
ncbi:non-hydrolyzing UDP-N-acetylglucosamine 2-epimerase [Thermodesulfobacteriota bacterium B35]